MNVLKWSDVVTIEYLVRKGCSIGSICDRTGHSRTAILRYRRMLFAREGVPTCACGLSAKHRGICWWRLRQIQGLHEKRCESLYRGRLTQREQRARRKKPIALLARYIVTRCRPPVLRRLIAIQAASDI